MNIRIYLNVVLMLSFTIGCYAQISNREVKAKIELETIENNIKITGNAENLTDIIQSLSYKLTVIKRNIKNDNRSSNSQEGLFTLQPNETKKLSTTQINHNKEDEIIILLLFYDENKRMVGKDRIIVENEIKTKKKIPADGFEMTGIIADQTKTKIGKDFYDMFYYQYNDKNINSKKIVTIVEELTFARNTKILITIDNEVVYEFIARPDEEYLDYMTEASIYATYQYLKNSDRQSKYLIKY